MFGLFSCWIYVLHLIQTIPKPNLELGGNCGNVCTSRVIGVDALHRPCHCWQYRELLCCFGFQISHVGCVGEIKIKVYFKVFCWATDGDKFSVKSHSYFRSDKLVRTEVDKLVFCNIKYWCVSFGPYFCSPVDLVECFEVTMGGCSSN